MRERRRRRIQEEAVDVVLDQRQIMSLRHLGQRFAALYRHRGSGRVVQRRHRIEHAQRCSATGCVERLGNQTLLVDGDRHQTQVQQIRQGAQARVGQRLDCQGVAGLGESPDNARHGMLAAGRHQDLLWRGAEPADSEKRGAGDAVLQTAGRGLIVEQRREIGIGRKSLQRRGNRCDFSGGPGPIDGEVDEVGVARFVQHLARNDRH